jgi:hypothetical protein
MRKQSKSRAFRKRLNFRGLRRSARGSSLRFCNPTTKLFAANAPYTGFVRTRCLSFHAGYRCQHVGECCRAGWDVEVEPHIVDAVRSGRVLPLLTTAAPFEPLPEGDAVAPARTSSGECGFHASDRCSLQEAGSESMLPSACRHFPRVYLRDARGTLLTLSHFCPTAAALLLESEPVTIVDAYPPLALEEPIEGLDARDALPPLVRPGLLSDIAGYGAWEEAVIRTFIDSPDAETAFARIDSATATVRAWSPSRGAMSSAVREAFAAAAPMSAGAAPSAALSRAFAIVHELTGPHPLMEVPPRFEERWTRIRRTSEGVMQGPLARYLAASTFANWIAYRGQGLRSIVEWLRACHDVLRVQVVRRLGGAAAIGREDLLEPFRDADYIMVHTVDSLAFGRAAREFEK